MGISSLLSGLSLIGFLAFLGGIALVVLSASQGRPVRGGVLLAVVGLLGGVVFSVVSQGILIVQPQQVAVIFNTLSGNLEQERRAGTHIVIPIVQESTLYPIEQQEVTMSSAQEDPRGGDTSVRARSRDGQEIRMDITVLFSIDPAQANLVHERWRTRYEQDLIVPTTRGFVRDAVSRFTAQQIYSEQRGEMEDSIRSLLETRILEEGFILTDVLVRDVTFSTEFSNSIEQAQIAQQEAERARLQVQRVEQEAEQRRAEAQGLRDAAILSAEGEAQAIVLRAQAEAEALRLVSEQIAANPSLIQYQYIQRLSGNVQLALVPTNSPFLFDFESLASPNPDFVAPAVPDAIVPSADLLPTPASPGS